MQTLMRFNKPELLELGLFRSPPPNQAALWRDGENVQFIDNAAEKFRGFAAMTEGVTNTITELGTAYNSGMRRVYAGYAGGVSMVAEGATSTIATGLGGSGRYSFEPVGDWLAIANGQGGPWLWKGSGLATNSFTDAPSAPSIVRKLANRLIFFKGQEVFWSSLTDVESFTMDPATRAGNLFLRDLDSDIIAVEPFGENLAIYTGNRMMLMYFAGGTGVYGFKTAVEGIGAVGRNSVIEVGKVHYGLDQGGVWVCDGAGFKYLDEPAVNRWLDENIQWLSLIHI